MSTQYDILCTACGETLSLEGNVSNYGRDTARKILACRIQLASFAQAAKDMRAVAKREERDFELGQGDYVRFGYVQLDLDWFLKHAGPDHPCVVVDEYGKIDGYCIKPVDCPTCGDRHCCGLLEGHAGECVPRGKS